MLGHDVTREPTTLVRRHRGRPGGRPRPQADRCELLSLQGKLYGLKGKVLGDQVAEVTELVGLTDAIDRRIQTYSGGMKRRLDPGLGPAAPPASVVPGRAHHRARPAVAGADLGPHPRAPRAVRSHHLPDHPVPGGGRRAGRPGGDHRPGPDRPPGHPAALKAEIGADVADPAVEDCEAGAARAAITELQAGGHLPEGELRGTRNGYNLFVPDGPQNIAVLIRGLDKAGVRFAAVSRPTLDDVFPAATGGRMAAAHEDGQGETGRRGARARRQRKEGIIMSAAAPDAGRAPGRTATDEPQTLAAPAGLLSDVVAITGRAIRGIRASPSCSSSP